MTDHGQHYMTDHGQHYMTDHGQRDKGERFIFLNGLVQDDYPTPALVFEFERHYMFHLSAERTPNLCRENTKMQYPVLMRQAREIIDSSRGSNARKYFVVPEALFRELVKIALKAKTDSEAA
jgi:hypothetical protein